MPGQTLLSDMTFYCRKNNPIWRFQLYVISLSLQKGDTSCSDWAISSLTIFYSIPIMDLQSGPISVSRKPCKMPYPNCIWSPSVSSLGAHPNGISPKLPEVILLILQICIDTIHHSGLLLVLGVPTTDQQGEFSFCFFSFWKAIVEYCINPDSRPLPRMCEFRCRLWEPSRMAFQATKEHLL